ncbi:MAG TPA: glucose 1-dehydrogenase [Xanthobacteraceae bacterium]|nr:glucose 1-dehydrogenase [Xanthobacteraceae bacterium]
MSLFDLSGRIAIVTGGNGGIGLGMAQGLASAGAVVVLAGRNAKKGEAAVQRIAQAGGKAEFAKVDVTSEASCRALIDAAAARHGRLDILVNNAGTNIRKPPDVLSATEWHTVIDTNLTSAFICTHAAYPHMQKARRGKIINIGSMMSIFGTGFAPAYAASKGGIVQFTRACATAWAKENIQVNAVLPGWIDTDLTRGARREIAGLNENVLAHTPAGRWGDPKDFGGIAVFLASAASDFVTGAAIPVDGGYSVQG